MDIVRTERLDIRQAWPNEAGDFTPWLAQHLDWLSDDLDLGPLTLEATEVAIPGGRSLDILAVDSEDRAIAIENQYGRSDHDHLTRGLAYAVAVQASDRPVGALIVIAEDHRDEFIAVADYLNDCAAARGDQGIPVFLVTVSLQRLDPSRAAVQFKALAQPNEWEASSRVGRQARLADFDALLDRLGGETVDTAQQLYDNWIDRGNATWAVMATESVVLYARNPRVEQKRCHVASIDPYHSGRLTINPGRLHDSGAFSEEDDRRLTELLDELLPPTVSTGKGYYLSYQLQDLDPAKVSQLFDWILERISV